MQNALWDGTGVVMVLVQWHTRASRTNEAGSRSPSLTQTQTHTSPVWGESDTRQSGLRHHPEHVLHTKHLVNLKCATHAGTQAHWLAKTCVAHDVADSATGYAADCAAITPQQSIEQSIELRSHAVLCMALARLCRRMTMVSNPLAIQACRYGFKGITLMSK